MNKAPVNRIIPFSNVDGPGNRTSIFFQGCSFACRFCHNPETIRLCVHCGACAKICKMNVDPVKEPDSAECIRCGECMKVCPKNALCWSRKK